MGIDRCRVKSIMETTFLTENQIWGDDALSVLKEYGVAAAPTDLAVILGAMIGGTSVDKKNICLDISGRPRLKKTDLSGAPTMTDVGAGLLQMRAMLPAAPLCLNLSHL